MKAFLMHADRDAGITAAPTPAHTALTQDLELTTLLEAMSRGDEFLLTVSRAALLGSLTGPAEIAYRQQVLRDCLRQPATIREIYDIATGAIAAEKQVFGGFFLSRSPDLILHRSVQVLQLLTAQLRALMRVAGAHAGDFTSEGFTRFFGMLAKELDEGYFKVVEAHLRRLTFGGGALVSARLGPGNKGTGYVLRSPRQPQRGLRRALPLGGRTGYTLTISDRDESGARALSELRGRGINPVANALAQSTDHILSFFAMLRAELAFYIGCLNLHEGLTGKGEPVCWPEPMPAGPPVLTARGLYDPCLTLTVPGRVVGNDVDADGKPLIMITGANQGGKSTFLRSAGLAQLMMQAGMFVAGTAFRATVATGLFTHYRREEDATMTSGKLDEELGRMSGIADAIGPGCLLLCNESFAATNEREGSQIARQVVRAMLDGGVRVLYVTHLFDLADGLYADGGDDALFLRAQRAADGSRTFQLTPGRPLPTSYGQDIYRRVFREPGAPGPRDAPLPPASGQAPPAPQPAPAPPAPQPAPAPPAPQPAPAPPPTPQPAPAPPPAPQPAQAPPAQA